MKYIMDWINFFKDLMWLYRYFRYRRENDLSGIEAIRCTNGSVMITYVGRKKDERH